MTDLRSGFRTTLQLTGLDAADVLEILWDTHGLFTHLERINLKEYNEGEVFDLERIGKIQYDINTARIMSLKATLRPRYGTERQINAHSRQSVRLN